MLVLFHRVNNKIHLDNDHLKFEQKLAKLNNLTMIITTNNTNNS